MASTGSPSNVYDEKGTVLYRAVPCTSTGVADENENQTNTAAVDCSSTVILNNSTKAIHATHTFATPPRSNKSTLAAATLPDATTTVAAASGKNNTVSGSTAAPITEALNLTPNSMTAEQALARLFPPVPLQQQQQDGKEKDSELTWMKVADIEHTSRLDAVCLREHLERRCKEENARPTGVVCMIREGIYTDGLREVIRQVTVLCPERGLLLAELATEMQQTTNTYDILFDSACQYAVRKAIERDLRSYLFDEKISLESEVRRLENRVNELRAKHDGMTKRFEEQKQAELNRYEEEVKYLKKANQQIVNEIKRITALEKSAAAAAAAAAAHASAQKSA
ncbi:dynein arm light chain, axonemal [Trypanosoma theileri]|uniref:Dynein arm light chain, axonemal n=1 Tax=Trypanosoma theileri TaxID=67003 RepID=A0A1X0NSA1_9TRYP|nr:dynein arm light chain, axonemal [Trypanosoma theileri]ORC87567.1 dynein arm light chain, axonemal [Trypanosoma theileri]